MKKKISLLLIIVLLIGVVPVFGGTNKLEDVEIIITDNKSEGNEFRFGIEYRIEEVFKGDYFDIQMPFEVNIDGGDFADVEHLGGTQYRLIFKDSFINIVGCVGGSQTVVDNSTLKQFEINGVADDVVYNTPNSESGGEVAPREPIYKNGYFINDDTILWSVYISSEDHLEDIRVRDVIGDGQQIIKDSVKFAILNVDSQGNEIGKLIEDNAVYSVIDQETLKITDTTIDFTIKGLNGGSEAINIVYESRVTDPNKPYYDNQLLLEGEEKADYKVVVEDWSDIGGDKPSEPEEPKPDNPKEPEEPKLPQVGELFLKWEYITGLILMGLALHLRTKNPNEDK